MVRMFDYLRGLPVLEEDLLAATGRVLRSGKLILGPETERFERLFSEWTGVRHCVGVTSGTVALQVALRAAGVRAGDEVLTVANTCAPTVAAIRLAGAVPVFLDVCADTLLMNTDSVEAAITDRTSCILPVHLWGNAVEMEPLLDVAARHNLAVVEDCAQATGTKLRKQHVGTFGQLGCFSFYPTKNLGSYGDAGAIITNDPDLAETCRRIRMYGYDDDGKAVQDGMNARISEIQAAMLCVKLPHLSGWIRQRREWASAYKAGIKNPAVDFVGSRAEVEHAFHQFVIRHGNRDGLMDWLRQRDIQTAVHYPVPLHRMPAYAGCRLADGSLDQTDRAASQILSLPVHEHLRGEELEQVVAAVNEFHG